MKNFYKTIIIFFLIAWIIPSALTAQSDPTLTVEAIEISGNFKTKQAVIENYLSIQVGQNITRQQLLDDQVRLKKTNFFKSVEILAIPGAEKGHAKIQIKIKEKFWPNLQFKSGFNELDGWYISPAGIRFDNMFGKGYQLGYEILFADRYGSSRLEFGKPFLMGTEYDFKLRIFNDTRQFLHFVDGQEYRQDVAPGGIAIGLSGNSGWAKYFSFDAIAEDVHADSHLVTTPYDSNLVLDAPDYLSTYIGVTRVNKLVFSFQLDTRNRKINPSSGWWGGVKLSRNFIVPQDSLSTKPKTQFTKIVVDVRRYQQIWKGLIFAGRAKYGTTPTNTPFFEKFYLGGPNSLRGYADRSLTPAGYAANLFQASSEIRFPLSARIKDKNRLTGVLFYDAGYAWNKPDKWDSKNIKAGLGYGVRVRLPIIGLLRLDFSYPVPDYKFQFHLSLGHTF